MHFDKTSEPRMDVLMKWRNPLNYPFYKTSLNCLFPLATIYKFTLKSSAFVNEIRECNIFESAHGLFRIPIGNSKRIETAKSLLIQLKYIIYVRCVK